jgi:RES domain-containing protein
MRIYRLCREKYARTQVQAFNGEGAGKKGGRWNPVGMAAAYASQTASLALLEMLTNADLEDLPADLVFASVEVPDNAKVHRVDIESLPEIWRNIDPAPAELTHIGSDWLQKNESLLMQVPSVIIPWEWNYVINPGSPQFDELTGFEVTPLQIDPRLGVNLA